MAEGQSETVLDYIDGISVHGDAFAEPANEYGALLCLRDGLSFLASQASKCDRLARERLNPTGNAEVLTLGNHPKLRDIPLRLLTCSFHWYAVSACQYVRTVGAIALQLDPTRPQPRAYVERVIPEVLPFRDKVAAHFAWATKNEKDSEAERVMSVMPPISFQNDAFFVGAWTLYVGSAIGASDSSAIRPWSIVSVHNRLRSRYWPNQTPGA